MRKGRFSGLSIAPHAAPGTPAWRRFAAAGLVLGAPPLVAAAALLGAAGWLAPAAAAAILLAWLGLACVRPALEAQPGDVDQESAQALRLVADFEESGCGWFWETDTDGRVSYLSESLAAALNGERVSLLGRRFAELLFTDGGGEGAQLPTLEFHLSSRFPFTNLIVASVASGDLCWSLSGRPQFDEVGRFLGFRGVGLHLTEEQRAEFRSSRVAACDSLTGLPNRARMRATLEEALRNSESRKEGCALLLVDLDRFKQVNDTLGHPVGDQLLVEVAARLREAIGSEGQVGRLGGDEFEAVLPGVDEEGVLAALAEGLIARLSAPYLIRGNNISVGASVGIAISRPGRTVADALVKEADLALYAAKAAGRGTYRFFEDELHADETNRQILAADLGDAIGSGQLRLAFQPMVSATSEDVIGFEALVRWNHPMRGRLNPGDFLAIAEANGLIGAIGEWVVRTACAEAARWPAHLRLAVNLSAAELEQPQLISHVTSALASSGLDPDRLDFDVPEAVLVSDSPKVRSTLSGLKALGACIALDDFGASGASIAALKSPLLDRLKLDAALVRAAGPRDGRGREVVGAVVALAGQLGIPVCAEGVETMEELVVVRELGCDAMQGYLLGRPVEAEEAGRLAAASVPVTVLAEAGGRPPRHSLIRRASLIAGGRARPVRLRNISAEGAMLETSDAMAPGAAVELDLSNGVLLAAQVRWAQDGRSGLRFVEPFDLKRLGAARRAQAPRLLRPDYLNSENSPDSPWAGRQDRLSVGDVKPRRTVN